MSDIVITGLGLVTPHGHDAESTWSRMEAGESAAVRPTRIDPEESRQFPPVMCEVIGDFDDHPKVDPKRMGRFTKKAVVAADEALEQAGLDPESDEWEPERTGSSISTCFGGLPSVAEGQVKIENGERISPYLLTSGMPNLAAGFVSIKFNAEGPSRAPSTACASASQAISDAVDDIRTGRTDVMIAGGTEAPQGDVPPVVGGFGAIRAFTPSDYDGPPAEASRPFDEDRTGFLMSEGAGVLILESREHAVERGANILAEITGTGLASDAAHPTGPREDAASLTRATTMALSDAEVDPDDVDLVNVHATSTPAGDKHEALALNKAFDDVPPVTANKSQLGHSGAACGAIEAALTTMMIDKGVVTPTINLENKDPECDVPVITERTEKSLDRVVSNSAGFGGLNVSLVIESP